MNNQNYNYNYNYNDQRHVHEFTGSTANMNGCRDCHNHRFCTMSGEAIRMGNSHVHELKFKTDFADEHFHEFCCKTCPAIEVGNGKHVHYFNDITETENGHVHKVQAASLIECPTEFKY